MMRLKPSNQRTIRFLAILVFALLALNLGSTAIAQDDAVALDPLRQGLQVARDIIEEELDSPLVIVQWLYYEDNWSINETWKLYGSFGIDNCVADIPVLLKRVNVLFGWTFTITHFTGKVYQARVSYDLLDWVICDEVHVPPQYAAVAPVAEAAAAAGPANEGPAGFALGGHILGFSGDTAALMKRAGMSWVKKQVSHGISDGGEVIQQAHAEGFKVLLGALGDKQKLKDDFDGYVAEFAQYVAFLASKGADAIEVWNEPNIDREWPAGQINGASYVKLLKAAYEAIKATNPNTLVISGAPAPTGYSATGCQPELCNDDVFMQQMAQAGAAQYMDCLGLHYNEGVVSPTQSSGDPRDGYPTRYFNSMLVRGAQFFPNSKICWTELGYLSGEGMGSPIPAGFNWTPDDPITVAEQAQWLADAARLSRDSGRVSLMIIWNVNFTVWGSDPQAGYAILRPDGRCPACDSLGAI